MRVRIIRQKDALRDRNVQFMTRAESIGMLPASEEQGRSGEHSLASFVSSRQEFAMEDPLLGWPTLIIPRPGGIVKKKQYKSETQLLLSHFIFQIFET